tara:strand:+ start:2522 stop:2650 length:129 start_codon:yes stop_codon:yes gene_type:complete
MTVGGSLVGMFGWAIGFVAVTALAQPVMNGLQDALGGATNGQ